MLKGESKNMKIRTERELVENAQIEVRTWAATKNQKPLPAVHISLNGTATNDQDNWRFVQDLRITVEANFIQRIGTMCVLDKGLYWLRRNLIWIGSTMAEM